MAFPTIDELIAQGMGRAVTVGAFSTGIVGGGAGTVLDLDQPELVIGVPSGYVIRPIYISCQVQPALAVTDSDENEILFAVDSLGLWSGAGTSTAEQPSNLRTDLDKGSACRVGSAFSADMTTTPKFGAAADPVLDMELDRLTDHVDIQGTAATIWHAQLRLLYMPNFPPFLVGPCSLLVYFGGTAATIGGFVQASWVEGKVSDMLAAV